MYAQESIARYVSDLCAMKMETPDHYSHVMAPILAGGIKLWHQEQGVPHTRKYSHKNVQVLHKPVDGSDLVGFPILELFEFLY